MTGTLLLVRDQNGNTIAKHVLHEVEASRIEGFDVKLSDDAETLILTIEREEV